MNGILIINKPSGWTSHDVVAKVRGLLKEKQIGHLGTLDPLATGVLPLAVGAATRLIEFASYPKQYAATCLLGKTTDSCDVTGKVLTEGPLSGLSEEKVREEVMRLQAVTEQVPPMVSAVKSGGKKLYELARKGLVVERKPRPIRIEKIEVLSVQLPRVSFQVACSAGTYVRVLCQSLGETLGCGGCMETLERTAVGPFGLKDALDLEEVKKRAEGGDPSELLLPSSRLVGHLPEIKPGEDLLKDLSQGKSLGGQTAAAGLYRVLNGAGFLSAVGEVTADGRLKPNKVFGMDGIR